MKDSTEPHQCHYLHLWQQAFPALFLTSLTEQTPKWLLLACLPTEHIINKPEVLLCKQDSSWFCLHFYLGRTFSVPVAKNIQHLAFFSLPNLSFWLDRRFLAALICRGCAWKALKSGGLCMYMLRLYQLGSVAVVFTIILVVLYRYLLNEITENGY